MNILKTSLNFVYLNFLTILIFIFSFFRNKKRCNRSINLISVNEFSGLGNYTKSLSAILNDLSIPHNLIYLSNLNKINYLCNQDDAYINIIVGNPDIVLPVFFKLLKFKFLKSINIGLWFWEMDNVPFRWKLLSRVIDEIWVSSRFIMRPFARFGLPTFKIPFLINKKELDLIPSNKSKSKNIFTFIFTFDFLSYFDRKNPIAVIDAFIKAFGNSNQFKLIIKSRNGMMKIDQKKLILDKIHKIKNITFIDKNYSYIKTLELVNKSDCYISLHRSEGLGLGMAEAMYLNKPVIATNYSGNLEFMNKKNSFLVNRKLVKIQSGQYIYHHQNNWAEPSIDQAAMLMRNVFEQKKMTKRIALKGKNDIHEHTRKKLTHRFVHRRLSTLGIN